MSSGETIQDVLKSFIKSTVSSLATFPSGASVTANAPGSVRSRPFTNRAGILKLVFVCSTSLYIGGLIAHKGASYLEENEIFVPTDEDDED